MKTFRTLIALIIAALLPAVTLTAQQGSGRIKVTVLDEKLAPLPGAIVKIVAGGPSTGGQTDLDGVFTFAGLTPGNYNIECRVTGYKRYIKTGVQVEAGQTAYADFKMELFDDTLGVVIIKAVQSPVDPKFSTIQNINADEVKHRAGDRGNINDLVVGTCSSCSEGAGGQLVMRGTREGASTVYVDGEKMYGNAGVPSLAINQVSVLSGGIPAEFGDLTGGAVIITTHSFYTGMSAKENRYEAAAEEEAAKKKAEEEKSGKRTEEGGVIIEQEDVPVPQEQPKQEEAPKNDGGGK